MVDLNLIRNDMKMQMKLNHYESVIAMAELLNANEDSPTDLYMYTEALFQCGQFRRVIHCIDRYQLSKKYLTFRLMAARCYFAIKDGISAIQILDFSSSNSNACKNVMNANLSMIFESNITFIGYDPQEQTLFDKSLKELETECYLLLGQIYESMENRDTAVEYYKQTLKCDVRCFKAAEKLCKGNMLTGEEARALLLGLEPNDVSADESKIAKIYLAMYEDMFNTVMGSKNSSNTTDGPIMLQNDDVMMSEHDDPSRRIDLPSIGIGGQRSPSSTLNTATRLYNNARFKKAYALTSRILEEDPHNPDCIALHTALLTQLRLYNELFSFASTLIDNYPEKKESWYAIGCYYLVTGRYPLARLQFLKATEIDKFYGFAWLAVGHTYSMDNERDQALAAYCSASQAIKGSHIPILYIALEYSLSNNSSVAVNYLQEAMRIGSHDPYCWHEKGFIAFNNKNYSDSLKFSLHAYDSYRKEQSSIAGFWEPLLNNIAHCFYKLGDYDKALEFFEKALGKKPKNPSTMSSMALVYTRKGDISKAMNYLNRVLGLDRENNFARTLMMTLTHLNCKYSNKSITDDSNKIKDRKVPVLPPSDSSTDPFYSQKHFESLRQILNVDASKISIEEKKMDIF